MQSISKRPFVQLASFHVVPAAAVCAVLLFAPVAQAQEAVIAPPTAEAPPVAAIATPQTLHFGQTGQWFLSGETFWTAVNNFGGNDHDVSYTWSPQGGGDGIFNLSLQPVVGYFFNEVVFGRLGIAVGYQHQDADLVYIGIEPGVGINIPVANKISFAPWLGLNYMYGHVSQSGASEDLNKLNLEVHVPIVYELADHFGFTAGIYYAQGLVNHASSGGLSSDGAKSGTIGLTTGLIGYW